MTDDQIIQNLHYYQKWRRGAKIEMPDPKELGLALDSAIRRLRQIKKQHYDMRRM